MARLYADEDFPFPAVLILRGLGHDVLTVHEAGRCGADDPEVLADATADGRAVLTHNHGDFRRLHRVTHPHGGIVSCTHDDNDPAGLAQRIHDAVSVESSLTNLFIRVIRPNVATNP
jgi:predicted nuclease of predicted toxin-antitoxin system